MNIHEDFHRCECGSADFKEEKVVTLLKGRPRSEMDYSKKRAVLDEQIHYICTGCNKKQDL